MIQIKLKWTYKRYNATQKVNALSEFVPYMSLFKNKMLKNSFFNSQFIYCPLIWVFHSRAANNKIYRSMRGECVWYMGIKRHPLKNYQNMTNLFQYTLGTCKCWLQKCLKCIDVISFTIYEVIPTLQCQM